MSSFYAAPFSTGSWENSLELVGRIAGEVGNHAVRIFQIEHLKDGIVKAMENYGWRLGTGFLSTPFILDVLAEMDIEYAYRLLENEEMPGWLFMLKNGATTIWESWEGTKAASRR